MLFLFLRNSSRSPTHFFNKFLCFWNKILCFFRPHRPVFTMFPLTFPKKYSNSSKYFNFRFSWVVFTHFLTFFKTNFLVFFRPHWPGQRSIKAAHLLRNKISRRSFSLFFFSFRKRAWNTFSATASTSVNCHKMEGSPAKKQKQTAPMAITPPPLKRSYAGKFWNC